MNKSREVDELGREAREADVTREGTREVDSVRSGSFMLLDSTTYRSRY